MRAEEAYGAAIGYINASLLGGGAVVGKNVIVSSIDPIEGGNRVTFSYTLDDGTVQESYMDVMDGKDGQDGEPGVPGTPGTDGVSITGIEKINTNGLVDTYQISFSDGSTFDYEVKNGEHGLQGLRGEQGKDGAKGEQGIQGIKGDKGDDGYPFLIYKEYDSLSEFNADDFPEIGLMFMVKEYDENNAYPVYRYTGEGDMPYSYITGLSSGEAIKGDKGDKGDQGEQGVAGVDGADGTTYQPTIGTVTAGDTASASIEVDEEEKTAKFNFVLPKGDKGDKGDPGENGVDGVDGENGTDGITPHIGDNKNWFIGDTDTGVLAEGKDGKSITKLEVDENYDLIATYDDNTTENLGKIKINVEADFLTDGGFGKLRYYNGKFQYFDDATETWVDAQATQDNTLVVNMMPNPMQRIIGIYDHEVGKNKLKWLEPEDTVVDGQVICLVEKVVIRRKLGSAPQNENDGDLVLTVEREDFGSHDAEWWFDDGVTPTLGDTWHYKAFPIATTGFANGSSMNQCSLTAKDHYLFGFTIRNGEPDTKSMMELVEDCKGFRYVGMDYAADVFNYGDWKDFWFIRDCKPCMLRYDCTVSYFLDKNNKKFKEDGTPSDVSNPDFEGNVMNQNPATYWKFVLNEDGSATYLFSDKELDGFVYWQNLDENGNFTPYWYTPCYPGVVIDGVMRSLSGYLPTTNATRQQEINYAVANNKNGEHAWYTEVMCDRQLINLLMLLIGGDTNTQTVYGGGNCNSYVSTSNTGIKKSGLLDDKGMFYGKNDHVSPMCAFGIENYYGNTWRALAGWINDHGTQKVKMTYGQSDGSTADGYNTTGEGYVTIPDATPSGTSGGYISACKFDECGLIPKQASGSATTYYADGIWLDNSLVNYALVGGPSGAGLHVGAFGSHLGGAASIANWSIGASLSCKPLA